MTSRGKLGRTSLVGGQSTRTAYVGAAYTVSSTVRYVPWGPLAAAEKRAIYTSVRMLEDPRNIATFCHFSIVETIVPCGGACSACRVWIKGSDLAFVFAGD